MLSKIDRIKQILYTPPQMVEKVQEKKPEPVVLSSEEVRAQTQILMDAFKSILSQTPEFQKAATQSFWGWNPQDQEWRDSEWVVFKRNEVLYFFSNYHRFHKDPNYLEIRVTRPGQYYYYNESLTIDTSNQPKILHRTLSSTENPPYSPYYDDNENTFTTLAEAQKFLRELRMAIFSTIPPVVAL